ncbi:hypothetical protein B0H19DRAFT_1192617 [Mycena capillaripes]|nr:hypothetical protein B0H19DRAFT_1192617 [Mycena capillaripes]
MLGHRLPPFSAPYTRSPHRCSCPFPPVLTGSRRFPPVPASATPRRTLPTSRGDARASSPAVFGPVHPPITPAFPPPLTPRFSPLPASATPRRTLPTSREGC